MLSFIKQKISPKFKMKMRFGLYYLRYGHKIILSIKSEKTVIVLGMHRSGTSIIAGILHRLGINMGKILLGANTYNKKGHYENKIIEELNKDIFKEAGGSWDSPPKQESINNIKNKFNRRIKRVIKLEQEQLWGWKDPRTVFTIELFLPYLFNPYFVVCRRDINEVAESLRRRNGFDLDKGRKLATTYNRRIDEFLSKYKSSYPILEIDFKDYFNETSNTINNIAKFLNINMTSEQKEQILNFIDPAMISSSKK